MNALAVLMGVAAGISIDAALTHGLVGLSRRPRDRVRLAFAVAALAVAAGALAVLGMYSADTAEAHVAIMKWVFFPSSVVWTVAAVWLVAFHTNVRPTAWLLALSAGFCLAVVLDLALPFGLLHDQVGELRSAQIAGAMVMVIASPSPHPLNYLTDALTLASFAFLYYAVYRLYLRGEHGRAAYLALAVMLLTLTTLADTFTDYGIVSSVYITQLGFVAVVLAISIALRKESLQAETELRAYRTQLESLVDARVRDLDQANALLAQEVQERQAAEKSLRRRVAELDALQHVSQTLADRTDLATALNQACREISEHFAACYSQVHLLGDHAVPQSEEVGSGTALSPSGSEGTALADAAVVQQAIRQRGPVVIADPARADLPAEMREKVVAEGVRHLLIVPMIARGDAAGVVSIARDQDGPAFSSRELRVARTMADTLAVVVESDRLHAQETRAAAADERQRLARDLHDAVTQSIYSASLIAEALPAVWGREPSEGLRNLVTLRRLVRGALAEMRTLLFELRPSTLDAAPLDTLLERLGDALAGQIQIPIDIRVSEDAPLPSDVKLAFYRVTQEAFSNIAKHAHAKRVAVEVNADGAEATLRVRDDGQGFDTKEVAQEHMGLRIMRERLDRVGAKLAIDSAPGRGTAVVVVWRRPGSADGLEREREA